MTTTTNSKNSKRAAWNKAMSECDKAYNKLCTARLRHPHKCPLHDTVIDTLARAYMASEKAADDARR